MKPTPLPLRTAIQHLRTDLAAAWAEAPETGVGFEVETVDVELQVVAETNARGELSGGWSVLGWNFGATAEMGATSADTHKITMSLTPILKKPNGSTSKLTVSSRTDQDL